MLEQPAAGNWCFFLTTGDVAIVVICFVIKIDRRVIMMISGFKKMQNQKLLFAHNSFINFGVLEKKFFLVISFLL